MSIKIVAIDTKPLHDPYTNIAGIVSKTYLKLDPRDSTIWVEQEYNDNATPIEEWNGLIITWLVPSHPAESAMRAWIDAHMDQWQRICVGYEVVWNGNNHVGACDADAAAARDDIDTELNHDGGPDDYYVLWTLGEWVDPEYQTIAWDTDDTVLRRMAHEAITALDANQLLDTDEDGVFAHFQARRNELLEEMEES